MSDIDKINERVNGDRARLAHSLDALSETVKPSALVDDMSNAASQIGSDLIQKASRSVSDNPAGALLVTVGLGLLASGKQRPPAQAPVRPATVHPDAALIGFDERVAKADAQMSGEFEQDVPASKLRDALNSGLDALPAAAQKRVIRAREAAISAQDAIETQARRAARKTKSFAYEQPLALGALALGFGVLAGSLLPGSRREDELLGKRREQLMAQARATLEDELSKAKDKAEAALSGRQA